MAADVLELQLLEDRCKPPHVDPSDADLSTWVVKVDWRDRPNVEIPSIRFQ